MKFEFLIYLKNEKKFEFSAAGKLSCKENYVRLNFEFNQIAVMTATTAAQEDKDAIVLEQNSVVEYDGKYSYVWRTSNGISAQESGVGGVSASGSYEYTSSDGVPVSFSYEADENGYRPQSDLLPQPPPVPEYIKRALEYILKTQQARRF